MLLWQKKLKNTTILFVFDINIYNHFSELPSFLKVTLIMFYWLQQYGTFNKIKVSTCKGIINQVAPQAVKPPHFISFNLKKPHSTIANKQRKFIPVEEKYKNGMLNYNFPFQLRK